MALELLVALIAAIIVALVGYFFRPIWQMLSGLWPGGTLPKVKGDNWLAEYTEPKATGPPRKEQESISLNQVGRFVWGKSRVVDPRQRLFALRAHLIGTTLIGTYKRRGTRTAVGTGAFQLKVAGNYNNMTGYCMWHDSDTDLIEISEYVWRRQ